MASENPAPPPAKPGQFFLKTEPLPGAAAGRYSNLYLRQHSVANPAVVLTEGTPRFLRASVADDLAGVGVDFTSWAPRHEGRKWALVLSSGTHDGTSAARWESVEIVDNGSDASLKFQTVAGEGVGGEVAAGEALRGGERWAGWMACEWSLGHPQLFWITDQAGDHKLPDFCERVRVVRALIQ
ncbi:hypothetical protein B0T24DRAFT_128908 [Lasiosphaeria ovina]|uniref:DUF7907 domain-containing protein n=1 Tax=Lasiosphaeria ovina TaxID=92902 RepID=A0AAE0JS47_9PEZI|nr:hypothetical protein B0T24DRAFT_128908 [Lasiosphaeria ovina]